MASESLLPEIITEILLKLPVESLLRCKSVCKDWHSLISDKHFIKSHYTLSSSSTNNINYQHHHRLILNKSEFHELSIDNYEIRNNLLSCPLYDVLFHESVSNAIQLGNPLQQKSYWFSIVGSCNGLLCISFEDSMFIYNPSTRICNELSARRRRRSRQELAFWYSFGYDESTDDYKLVEMSDTRKVNIFALKTRKWKKLGDFPYTKNGCGKFLNGALHWLAYARLGSSCTWRIVSLDLAKETYGDVLLPEYDEDNMDLTLGVLGECLCVLCNHYESDVVDVWVMTVYGVKDSWTKLASISCPTHILWDECLEPLCISSDGKVLLQFELKLLVCDSKDSSSKMIDNSDVDGCCQACIVVESLVSPLGLSNNIDDEN